MNKPTFTSILFCNVMLWLSGNGETLLSVEALTRCTYHYVTVKAIDIVAHLYCIVHS